MPCGNIADGMQASCRSSLHPLTLRPYHRYVAVYSAVQRSTAQYSAVQCTEARVTHGVATLAVLIQ